MEKNNSLPIKEIIEFDPIRQTIAERMMSSLQNSAQLTLMREAKVNGLVKFRESLQDSEYKPTYTEILVKIVAKLLTNEENKLLNSFIEDNKIKVVSTVNLGVAVATNYGLVVPVIKNANNKDLVQIVKELRELSNKAKNMQLTLEDIEGGTFTLTNLGMFGIDSFTPIINPPQTGILGVGRIYKRPEFDENNNVIPSYLTWLSLTFDHRVLDGASAAIFLKELSEILDDDKKIQAIV
ncbi:pyruvate/2-oxoglutarate dehydrogenase complex, dihydrolipoamide acyltransferase component [Caldisphaera lagunensis DSM 15908]|uniref:Pyruvate/2-oxoglutarate dehydrogenase complex, dihydrolipoamide acyltransferase component n=1 Tax=Caldisphaera lagunensis (strain DSM 15908 / JCM 11604 / ANMR 0165 / IC-154) TaxID=1056495 RepID=L0AAG0_CALLD|nr:dihydrolipoamide acetyltransferase family protein [Caldisphaera lagunensis]AFZ70087.1 pyruvate/2-oxoglutarate dehydrogenase complex, dihydrolipoamide acyltransferase component [Caldisphaera lagunensis DSM 15908]